MQGRGNSFIEVFAISPPPAPTKRAGVGTFRDSKSVERFAIRVRSGTAGHLDSLGTIEVESCQKLANINVEGFGLANDYVAIHKPAISHKPGDEPEFVVRKRDTGKWFGCDGREGKRVGTPACSQFCAGQRQVVAAQHPAPARVAVLDMELMP